MGTLQQLQSVLYILATEWVLCSMSQLEPHLLPKIGCLLDFMPSIQIISGKRIVLELVKGKSKVRLMFVTVAFGLGINVREIRCIVHIGVPYTLEEYFQEAGRCGRDGLPGNATIYFNSYDISTAKRN